MMSQQQDIKSECPTFLDDLARIEVERDALQVELAQVRAELELRDLKENRNCLNWGACARHDDRKSDVG